MTTLWPNFLRGKNQANNSVRRWWTILPLQFQAWNMGFLKLIQKRDVEMMMICGVRLVNSSRDSGMAV